jgi:hypothetical protein
MTPSALRTRYPSTYKARNNGKGAAVEADIEGYRLGAVEVARHAHPTQASLRESRVCAHVSLRSMASSGWKVHRHVPPRSVMASRLQA